MTAATRCPYCDRNLRGAARLRDHIGLNECGRVPADVAKEYAADEHTSEDDYRKTAEKVARANGWLVNHVERARGRDGRWLTPCAPGFPDDLFVHPDGHVLIVEFKAKRGRLQANQSPWLDAFAAAGARTIVARPETWPLIQSILTSPNHGRDNRSKVAPTDPLIPQE